MMESRIKLTKEEVIFDASRIDLSSYMASLESVPVKCTFYFKNISEDTVDIKMGFPFMQSIKFQDIFKLDFTTFIDGKETSIKKDSNDTYPEIYIWNIKFLPKEDKKSYVLIMDLLMHSAAMVVVKDGPFVT